MASLTLYSNFARTALAKATPWQDESPLDIDIEITGGLHAGSCISLSKHCIVIGPSETGDVMLLDASAMGNPVTITAERSFLGPMISVAADREDVTVNDQRLKPNEKDQTFRLPCTMMLGEVPLRISPNEESAAPVWSRPSSDSLRIGVLSCICVLAFGFATGWGQFERSPYDLFTAVQAEERAAPSPSPKPSPVPTTVSVTSLVAASLINVTLGEYDLGNYLSAAPKSAQAIAIRGTLPEDMRGNWYAAREQLHNVDRKMLVLPEFDIAPAHPKLPAIASVRLGDNPGLIFADNSIAVIGDTVSDRWQLDSVDEAGFTISRFGVSLDVNY